MLKELLLIYWTYFKMGAVTFGGGYAMLPILRREIVENKKWADEETVMDFYALSQGLPGIIAANVSTFLGYKKKGVPGAVAAVLGVVSPCIIIISAIVFLLTGFRENVYVQHALACVSVCVLALIVDAVIAMWKKGVKDWLGILICLVTFGITVFTKVSPVIAVVVAAVLGVLYYGNKKNLKEGK